MIRIDLCVGIVSKEEGSERIVADRRIGMLAKVMEKLNEENKSAIMGVYCRRNTMGDNVYLTALELGWEEDKLWALVSRVTRRVAKERGLV